MLKNIIFSILTVCFAINVGIGRPKNEAGINMKFMRLYINVDPAVQYINGYTTHYFSLKNRNERDLPIKLDLSDSLTVSCILHNYNTRLNFSQDNNKLIIYPKNVWQETDSITIVYGGKPQKTGIGSVCFDHHENIPAFWTLSEPYGAKDWFPCKQDISDKIDSSYIIISCPKRYRAVSNGKLYSEIVTGATRITEWHHRYPCAYYLLAVAVTEYKVYSDWVTINNDSIEIVNYVYPERYEQCKRKSWKLANAFKMMCDSFGLYPFADEKYGHAQFGWHGGMEHQTISFLCHFELDLMIHELAHQWFGDMITCKSWKDVFVNEGFAHYCEYLATEKGYAQGRYPEQWRKHEIEEACKYDNSCIFIPDTTDYHNIFCHETSYSKGAMVLHMLRREIGDAAFFSAMKAYVNDFRLKYHNATAEDFFKIVNIISGKNMDWFYRQWILGTGFPIYKIEWQQMSDGLVNIKIHQNASDSSNNIFRVKIPLIFFGLNDEQTIFRLNNFNQDQFFTVIPNFTVKYVIFDPNSEIISKGSTVNKAKITNTDDKITINSETKTGKVKVLISDYKNQYSWYILRDIKTKESTRGKIPNNGKIEIHTAELPEGQYILQLDGNKYYSTRISIYHPHKLKKSEYKKVTNNSTQTPNKNKFTFR
ncbi:MAG: M1 family metallopeptidase [Bacteroidales bacterium]|nr:M1 family metallopeptidase [Bacteroidales bacterium]